MKYDVIEKTAINLIAFLLKIVESLGMMNTNGLKSSI